MRGCPHSHVCGAGSGLAAPRSTALGGPGGLGTGSVSQELLQKSLDEDLPAEMVHKTAAQGLARVREVRAVPAQQKQSRGVLSRPPAATV